MVSSFAVRSVTTAVFAALGLGAAPSAIGHDPHCTAELESAGSLHEIGSLNQKPRAVGEVKVTTYDGITDDLLTAGLGKTGLGGAAPAVTNPTDAAQLRRLAIWTNYRAILDITPNGGYGRLYGPNIDVDGNDTLGEGKIAGTEYLAFADRHYGSENVTMMVQVPASFDPARPCIVTATSSGSRGVYGAIGSSGEWGLKHGCAVAYTDKGSGNGVHDLATNTVNLIDGVRADAATAGDATNFTARLTDDERAAFNAATPNRIAVKHAHSQRNPEREWGLDTLTAIRFAFWVLNEQFGPVDADGRRHRTIVAGQTVVIASSVSNGAGAALAAAEQDEHGLISGVAVTEPNIQVAGEDDAPKIQRGNQAPYTAGSRPLLDYFTFGNLYQPCAALSARAADAPLGFSPALAPLAANRCTSLKEVGLLSAATTAAQADEALDKLLAYGWEAETIPLQVSHWRFATPAIVMTYSNAHGRFSVTDNLCGFSFAATDATGSPIPLAPAALATVFGTGNGVPPSAGINIVNNNAVGGPRLDAISVSPNTQRADFNLAGALCQRGLLSGGTDQARRVQRGVRAVQRSADLRHKPTLIVHGRADTLVPVNFSSRSYVALNRKVEGRDSKLSYVEVTNAQHFDAFLGFPGYDTRFVPLHVYFIRGLDAMYAHLTQGTKLPPSQVVHTSPRGGTPGAAPAITAASLPPIAAEPATAQRIEFRRGVMVIPD